MGHEWAKSLIFRCVFFHSVNGGTVGRSKYIKWVWIGWNTTHFYRHISYDNTHDVDRWGCRNPKVPEWYVVVNFPVCSLIFLFAHFLRLYAKRLPQIFLSLKQKGFVQIKTLKVRRLSFILLSACLWLRLAPTLFVPVSYVMNRFKFPYSELKLSMLNFFLVRVTLWVLIGEVRGSFDFYPCWGFTLFSSLRLYCGFVTSCDIIQIKNYSSVSKHFCKVKGSRYRPGCGPEGG